MIYQYIFLVADLDGYQGSKWHKGSHCSSSVTFSFTCPGGEEGWLGPSVGLGDTVPLLGEESALAQNTACTYTGSLENSLLISYLLVPLQCNSKGELDKKIAWTLVYNTNICTMMDDELKSGSF